MTILQLWIDKFNGDGYVWYNGGRGDPAENAGSTFRWDRRDSPVYDGNVAGTCEYYPDLDGDGRADSKSSYKLKPLYFLKQADLYHSAFHLGNLDKPS